MSTVLFKDLKLSADTLRSINDMGFEKATRIQADTIPPLLDGKDIVGQSETGSGKTAAFVIPLVERVTPKIHAPQGIVLCPTRELAIQVAGECTRLIKYKKGINVIPVYGGQPMERQLEMLKRGVHIVIGTPGRILDHLDRGTLSLDAIKIAVLDEADEMLDMGFRDDIMKILDRIPDKPQMAFFSATIPDDIRDMITKYMTHPRMVRIEGRALTVAATQQFYFDVEYGMKAEVLCRLIDIHNLQRGLIFCNQKRTVDELVLQLQAHGYTVEGLHGDLRQVVRDRVMNAFRKGAVKLLVATDVAARGIDVDNVDAVVNFDLPQDEEDYVHRIGRTGRAGKEGTAFSFVSGRGVYKLRSIERFAGVKISRRPTPTSDDAREQIMGRMIEKVRETISQGHLSHFVNMVDRICGNDYTAMDVAAALLKMNAPKSKPVVKLQSPPREDRRMPDKSKFFMSNNGQFRKKFNDKFKGRDRGRPTQRRSRGKDA
jgi:ATP-dependent RNA helicase DeaD